MIAMTGQTDAEAGRHSVATAADMYVCLPRSKWQGEKPATVGHFQHARRKITQYTILGDSEYISSLLRSFYHIFLNF